MDDLGSLIESYGYIGIFVVLVLGIVGLPIPDEVLMTYVGYNIFIGRLSWSGAVLAALAGSVVGITISYLLGIKLGLPFLRRFGPKLHISESRIGWTQAFFARRGGLFLMFGYFLPGIRHITAYVAGIANYRFGKFAIFAYLGAIIWVNFFITLGLLLGDKWPVVERVLHGNTKYIIIGTCLALAAYLLIRYRKRRKKKLG
ncbi:membrane protein DedA, SNARE-associated domain [Terribacillus aidingensis]|uniref:Membrane protein DedA, SNARE-associated domain n=1 Tax=Terribacillus aidingensis TaxID=586416 RepID=A0A285P2N7_9BACI|nr:DedA family protein [Terribacillus aidingensis]SNZ15708.1 membrane protein DedA, SNARE-associated domain [Terribacillus aidingensis]